MNLLLIGVTGILGVYTRYFIDSYFLNKSYITGTLIVNTLGCIVAGTLMALLQQKSQSQQLYKIIIIGFCGGLTTFSAFILQGFNLIHEGEKIKTMAYLIGSPLLGLISLAFAYYMTNTFFLSNLK